MDIVECRDENLHKKFVDVVDVGFPTRPHSLIPCIAGNGLHPAIIYQIIDLAPHAYGNRVSNWRGTSVFICIRIILSYYQWWWKSLSFSL